MADDAHAPAVIDHTAFPHLLESIIGFAPREALLALRCTSRHVQELADAALAAHLVLAAGTAGVPPDLSTREGRHPLLRRRRGAKGCESLWAGARVVDVVGMVGAHPRSPFVMRLNSLGAVRVVRMRHPPAGRLAYICVIRAPTLVVFTTIAERDDTGEVPALAEICMIPDKTRRAVFNIRYDVNRPWLAQAHIMHPGGVPESCTELVFIFTEKATHREPQVGGGIWPAKYVKGMVHTVLELLGSTRARPDVTATLVDVHTLRPEWLGDAPDASADDIKAGIIAAVDDHSIRVSKDTSRSSSPSTSADGNDTSPSHRTSARSAQTSTISFVSRKEYRRMVGEAVFSLETVE